MSAVAAPTTKRPRAIAAPTTARLITVELRKMTSTRSGLWVPIVVGLLTLAVSAIASLNNGGRQATLTHVLHATVHPSSFLLPVIGVLLICAEWSQRTALTTFTLVPNRWRVIGAKLGASTVAATVALAVCLVSTVVFAIALGNHPGGVGGLGWQAIAQSWLFLVSSMVTGFAFGAAVLISAPAIVAYLLLPTLFDVVASNISALSPVATWLDPDMSLAPFALHVMSATEWLHAAATFGVWIGIPIVIGAVRIGRGDID